MLSLTRGQAVVWPKFSASGCEISLNVPLTPRLAVILEKLGKSETRERQIFERNEVYHGRSNFRNVSNFSHENDLCKPAFNNIKVFSFELSRTSHNVLSFPLFSFHSRNLRATFCTNTGPTPSSSLLHLFQDLGNSSVLNNPSNPLEQCLC